MVKKSDAGNKAEHHYFRVVITYSDGEASGNRVFKDRAKAEKWATRQQESPVVKKAKIEEFTRNRLKAKSDSSENPKAARKRLSVSKAIETKK